MCVCVCVCTKEVGRILYILHRFVQGFLGLCKKFCFDWSYLILNTFKIVNLLESKSVFKPEKLKRPLDRNIAVPDVSFLDSGILRNFEIKTKTIFYIPCNLRFKHWPD